MLARLDDWLDGEEIEIELFIYCFKAMNLNGRINYDIIDTNRKIGVGNGLRRGRQYEEAAFGPI